MPVLIWVANKCAMVGKHSRWYRCVNKRSFWSHCTYNTCWIPIVWVDCGMRIRMREHISNESCRKRRLAWGICDFLKRWWRWSTGENTVSRRFSLMFWCAYVLVTLVRMKCQRKRILFWHLSFGRVFAMNTNRLAENHFVEGAASAFRVPLFQVSHWKKLSPFAESWYCFACSARLRWSSRKRITKYCTLHDSHWIVCRSKMTL